MTEQVNGTIAAQELQSLLELIDAREQDLRARIASEKERAAAEMTSQLDGVIGDGADYAGARIRAGIENEMVERHTRDLAEFGGLAKVMPWYAAAFVIITLSLRYCPSGSVQSTTASL